MASRALTKYCYLQVACTVFKHTRTRAHTQNVYGNKHKPCGDSMSHTRLFWDKAWKTGDPAGQTMAWGQTADKQQAAQQSKPSVNIQRRINVTVWTYQTFFFPFWTWQRFLPPDQNAAGRIHLAGAGDSVQQWQGAGPAELAGQIHEKCRYWRPLTRINSNTFAAAQQLLLEFPVSFNKHIVVCLFIFEKYNCLK